ncbi:Myb/SANT-like DNA-binding domain protein [Rhynchospora pubera]|uniref:Myb/SANT-like DNA-binding domain protein n=1 Tax=Rhynchospora pubera TaxID=906938 RepID=A0AAV8CGY6_9POAL|nr:Myb/SANT-like DNA-binding domain protein [Rhynchospora pubera]
MDQSEECMTNKQKGKRKQNWSGDQTKLMLHLIREEQVSGRVAGSGTFTKQFWKKLATVLSSQSEPERQGEECKTRWKTLKQDFSEYKQCRERTGWGWCATKRVPVGPEDEWEELKMSNSKLYKCKTKPFDWYSQMLEIVGGNVANGSSAAAYNPGVPLEDLMDLSDSSGSNRDIGQDLNEVNMDAVRAQWGTKISMLGGDFDDEINMQQSPLPRSGAASRTSSSKRVLEQSDGVECDDPANKKSLGNKNKCDDPTSKKSLGACIENKP